MKNPKYTLNRIINAFINGYYGRTPHYWERGKYNKAYKLRRKQMSNEYILIDSEKVAKIKYEALQKIARHSGEPLSEASIEARAVIDVVNYLYENNEWIDIHNRVKSDETGYQELRYTEFKIKDR